MATQARVTSTEALETFRASLIVFLAKAHRSVDDVCDEVRRTRIWLQQDQRMHWEGERKRRAKALERAEQELMTARIASNQENAVLMRQAAVTNAKRLLAESEDKLRILKRWTQNYDNAVDPSVKKLESFRQFLADDLPKAVLYLSSVQRTLEAYSAGATPSSGSGAATTTAAEPEAQP